MYKSVRGYEVEVPHYIGDFIADFEIVETTGWELEYIESLSLGKRLAIEGIMRGKSRAQEANRE